MNLSDSPCHRCPRADTCGDDWYGCPKWQGWFREKWRGARAAYRRKNAILLLYLEGKNDYQIAAEVGVTPSAICQWRKRKGLPSVGKRGPKPRKATCAERGRWEGTG